MTRLVVSGGSLTQGVKEVLSYRYLLQSRHRQREVALDDRGKCIAEGEHGCDLLIELGVEDVGALLSMIMKF